MSGAQIIQFPRRTRGPIRVERVEGGDWHVIHGGQGWPHGPYEEALQEAGKIAAQGVTTTIIIQALRS